MNKLVWDIENEYRRLGAGLDERGDRLDVGWESNVGEVFWVFVDRVDEGGERDGFAVDLGVVARVF